MEADHQMRPSISHSADVTGVTNFTVDNLIVWTFLSNENEANSRIIFTKWLREGLLNSLHCTNWSVSTCGETGQLPVALH